ncbi:MAG: transketolase [bacterium]
MSSKMDLETKCINTIRMLAVDGVQKANSGHPGMPMGAAPMAYTLWSEFLRHNPANPGWPNRDRFILSAGHGSMLLYSLLHLTGYDLSLDDLKKFRQWNSRTPGHPESHITPGVETTTGPLGQGISNAVGIAIAEAHIAEKFNRPSFPIMGHYTYVIVGDGDLMEGVSAEASSLAGHLGLGKLIVLYDDNHITIEGSTDLAFTEDVMARYIAYDWHVQKVENGNDTSAVREAIKNARQVTSRPSFISVRTHIAYGSPNKQDSASAHGAPLGDEEVLLTKKNLGWPVEPDFHIPEDSLAEFRKAVKRGEEYEGAWSSLFAEYQEKYPDLAKAWNTMWKGELPDGWEEALPDLSSETLATRAASGKVINALAGIVPNIIGGSADLAPSTNTLIDGEGSFSREDRASRNLHFGVREHAMGAIANGMVLHGALRPYVATFLIFSDYMRPTLRLASLERARTIFIFTHDSIGVGEDGPTHQPVEQIPSLRAIPGLIDLRPGDAAETVEAWKIAMKSDSPVFLALTRQKLEPLHRDGRPPASSISRGAYILAESGYDHQAIIMASGSEVATSLAAMELLQDREIGVRVVNFASFELFEQQDEDYRNKVLPPEIAPRVAVEAAASFGWERYTGLNGAVIGVDRFGASAPGNVNFEKFGFTAENIAATVQDLLSGK